MSTRIVSIVTGLMLMLIVGGSVYAKKQSQMVSVSPTPEVIGTPSSTPTPTPTPITYPRPPRDDDEEEDDDGGGSITPTTAPTPSPTPSPTPATTGGITMTQVATHNSRTSCWSAINGSVYDLTSWIPNHPGGEQVILSICGIDGSSAFNGQHGGKSKPTAILAGFKIGTLK